MTRLAPRRLTLLAAVVLALGLAGEAAAEPDITLEPAGSVSFGHIDVGAAMDRAVGVVNDGTSAGTIGSITVSGDPSFSVALDDCGGLILEPNEFCVVYVRFAPTAPGPQTAQLTVANDAPLSPDVLPLDGTGVTPLPTGPPSFEVSTTVMQLGNRPPPFDRFPRFVHFTNRGTSEHALNIAVEGPDANAFAVQNRCSGPVQPGRNCSVGVTFSATHPGAHEATLVASVGAVRYTVALIGSGPPVPRPEPPANDPPDVKSIRPALVSSLQARIRVWKGMRRRALRRRNGFALRSPASALKGRLTLDLRTTGRRTRVVAQGRLSYPISSARTLIARLTRVGRALLASPGKQKLRATVTFTTRDGDSTASSRTFTLPG